VRYILDKVDLASIFDGSTAGRDPMAAFGKSSRRHTKKTLGVVLEKPVGPENKKRWSFFWGIHGKFSGDCMCMSGRLWYVSELALNNKWNGF